MVIKQIPGVIKAYSEQAKISRSQKTADVRPAQKKDEVILSAKAQEFSQMLKAAKEMPEVRDEKVKELSAKIAAGNYRVDARDIAEKMIGLTLADNKR